MNEGRLDEALEQFEKAIASDPSSQNALNKAGWILLLKKNSDESVKKFDRSIKINPHEPETYMMRAGAYIQNKEWQKALDDYQKASELSPDNPDIYFGIGRLYLAKKEFGKSEEFLNKALEKNPDQPVYLLSRSFSYINQEKFQKAKMDAQRVLENSNIDLDTRIGALLAIAEIEMVADNNHKKARKIYDEVLIMRKKLEAEKKKRITDTGKHKLFDIGFDHWENPHLGRAVTFLDNGQYEKALEELNLALNDPINPQPVAWLHMTVVYYKMGERDKAKTTAEKWFAGSRYDIEHYHEEELASEEALAYMIIGDFDNALKKIDYSIKQNREFLYNRALIYMEKGDNESARLDLEDYLREFPEEDNPEIVEDIRKAKKILQKL